MNMNWLKINPTKTVFMYIASQWQIKKCAENLIRVGSDMVERSALIKLLGTWLDETFIIQVSHYSKVQEYHVKYL